MKKSKKAVKSKKKTAPKAKRSLGKKKIKVGIFGGTFNPVHFGHMNSLETVLAEMKLNQIWVVPALQNPLREKEEGPKPEHRLKMLELALSSLNQGDEKFVLKDDEIVRGGISYTIDTVKQFEKKSPEADLFLIIGADQLETFNKWKDFRKLLEKVNLVVTSRPGSVLPKKKDECPEWLAELVKSSRPGKFSLKTGKTVQFIMLNDVAVSATEVRKKMRIGSKVDHLVPNMVLEYIRNENLYKEVKTKISDYTEFTKFCADVLKDMGGLGISAYDVRNMVQPTEFAMAVSGTSTRHAKSLAEKVVKQVKEEYGVYPQGTEGLSEGRWVVLDYGSLMIHIFYDFVRNEYRIEDIWQRGSKIL